MTTIETILSILVTLLGGTNIVTLAQLTSLKRKGSAEADQAQITSLTMIIEANQKEIARQNDRIIALESDKQEWQTKYNDLYEKYNELRELVTLKK